MQAKKFNQAIGIIAGILLLLATIIMYFFANMPYGDVPFVNLFNEIIYPQDVASLLEPIIWLLIFPAGLFSAICAFTCKTKLNAISFLVYGGLNTLDSLILIIAFSGGIGVFMGMVIPISFVLAGLSLLSDNSTMKLISAISAGVGFLLYMIRRIVLIRERLMNDFFEGAKDITSGSLWIISQLLLAAAVVLIVFAKEQTAAVGAVHAPYMAAQPMATQAAIVRCPNCGSTIAPGSTFCGSCGSKVEPAGAYSAQTAATQQGMANTAQTPPNYPYRQISPMDAPSTGYAVLSFFFPGVGLILYLVWKDEYPMRAKSVGKGAIIGAIAAVVLWIIYFLVAIAIASM